MKKLAVFALSLVASASIFAAGPVAAQVPAVGIVPAGVSLGTTQEQQQSTVSDTRSAATNTGNVTQIGLTLEAQRAAELQRQQVEYSGKYTLKNVPSVNAPPLTTSNDTCMGSTSGSANVAGFGGSFGTTWVDLNCRRLKNSREQWNKGNKAASLAIDCMDDENRRALEMTGLICPQSMTAEERRAAYGPRAWTGDVEVNQAVAGGDTRYSDPYIARRMGTASTAYVPN